jgi:hypothetical protein
VTNQSKPRWGCKDCGARMVNGVPYGPRCKNDGPHRWENLLESKVTFEVGMSETYEVVGARAGVATVTSIDAPSLTVEQRTAEAQRDANGCARCPYRGTFSDGSTQCGKAEGHSGPHYSNRDRWPLPELAPASDQPLPQSFQKDANVLKPAEDHAPAPPRQVGDMVLVRGQITCFDAKDGSVYVEMTPHAGIAPCEGWVRGEDVERDSASAPPEPDWKDRHARVVRQRDTYHERLVAAENQCLRLVRAVNKFVEVQDFLIDAFDDGVHLPADWAAAYRAMGHLADDIESGADSREVDRLRGEREQSNEDTRRAADVRGDDAAGVPDGGGGARGVDVHGMAPAVRCPHGVNIAATACMTCISNGEDGGRAALKLRYTGGCPESCASREALREHLSICSKAAASARCEVCGPWRLSGECSRCGLPRATPNASVAAPAPCTPGTKVATLCAWYDEDTADDPSGCGPENCGDTATHWSCCYDLSPCINVCEKHRCRCKQPDPLGPLQALVDLAEKTKASVNAALDIAAEASPIASPASEPDCPKHKGMAYYVYASGPKAGQCVDCDRETTPSSGVSPEDQSTEALQYRRGWLAAARAEEGRYARFVHSLADGDCTCERGLMCVRCMAGDVIMDLGPFGSKSGAT